MPPAEPRNDRGLRGGEDDGRRRETHTTVPRRRTVVLLLAAPADPGQAPAPTRPGLGVHQALKIADVGADGDVCRCGMHFRTSGSLSTSHDSVRISFTRRLFVAVAIDCVDHISPVQNRLESSVDEEAPTVTNVDGLRERAIDPGPKSCAGWVRRGALCVGNPPPGRQCLALQPRRRQLAEGRSQTALDRVRRDDTRGDPADTWRGHSLGEIRPDS